MQNPTDALRQAFVSNNQGAIVATFEFSHRTELDEPITICSDTVDRTFLNEEGHEILFKSRDLSYALGGQEVGTINSYSLSVSNADKLFNDTFINLANGDTRDPLVVTHRLYLGDDLTPPQADKIVQYGRSAQFHGPDCKIVIGFFNFEDRNFPSILYTTDVFPHLRNPR